MNANSADRLWLEVRVRLREDLIFRPQRSAGKSIYTVEDPLRSKFYRLGRREYLLVARFDGHRSVGEALREANEAATESEALSESEAVGLLQWAYQNGLLAVPAGAASDVSRASQARRSRPSLNWNPIYIRVPLGNPEPFLSRLYPYAAWLYSRPATVIGMMLIVVAVFQLAVQWDRFLVSIHGIFSPSGQVSLFVCWTALKLLHEISHGLVCKRYGGSVREAGVLFVLFVPLAFVDVTRSWRFRSKWQRIHTAAAGMQLELLVAAVAAILWSRTESGILNQACANVVVMASVTTVLFNANPLMRFDGYYIFTDLLELPNLYSNGQAWLRSAAGRLFLGWSSPGRTVVSGNVLVVRTYAVLTFLWRLTVYGGMIVAAAVLWKGAGIVLAATGVLAWIALPLARLIALLVYGEGGRRPDRRRFAIVSAATAAAAALLLVAVPWPGVPRAAAIVQYDRPSVVRVPTGGFVEEILVPSGGWVAADAPLAVLRNDELHRDYAELELKLRASQLRSRAFRGRHETAKLNAELEESAALGKQLAELHTQLDALTIRAPQAGQVVTRGVENLIGTYMHQGDMLLELGNDTCKSIQFCVPQVELSHYEAAVGKTVFVSCAGDSRLACRLKSINPRATTTPPVLALCTHFGGGLVVRHVDRQVSDPRARNSTLELLEPHFTGTIELSELQSRWLRTGQRMTVQLPGSRPSLGGKLWELLKARCRAKAARYS